MYEHHREPTVLKTAGAFVLSFFIFHYIVESAPKLPKLGRIPLVLRFFLSFDTYAK
jgi:hypothetical protein